MQIRLPLTQILRLLLPAQEIKWQRKWKDFVWQMPSQRYSHFSAAATNTSTRQHHGCLQRTRHSRIVLLRCFTTSQSQSQSEQACFIHSCLRQQKRLWHSLTQHSVISMTLTNLVFMRAAQRLQTNLRSSSAD